MEIAFCTIFPELVNGVLSQALFSIAEKKGVVRYDVVNIRDFAVDKHGTVDDYPYGGGPGMIMMVSPIVEAVETALGGAGSGEGTSVILLDPSGEPFTQSKAFELSQKRKLVFICGHYKGVDERVRDILQPEIISIGDYILSGGELPALIVAEAAIRYLPGVLGDERSRDTDSFTEQRSFALDASYYTRPPEYRGVKVPDVLLSGNHEAVAQWRKSSAEERTRRFRPDLLKE